MGHAAAPLILLIILINNCDKGLLPTVVQERNKDIDVKYVGAPVRLSLPNGQIGEIPFGYELSWTPKGVSPDELAALHSLPDC